MSQTFTGPNDPIPLAELRLRRDIRKLLQQAAAQEETVVYSRLMLRLHARHPDIASQKQLTRLIAEEVRVAGLTLEFDCADWTKAPFFKRRTRTPQLQSATR